MTHHPLLLAGLHSACPALLCGCGQITPSCTIPVYHHATIPLCHRHPLQHPSTCQHSLDSLHTPGLLLTCLPLQPLTLLAAQGKGLCLTSHLGPISTD